MMAWQGGNRTVAGAAAAKNRISGCCPEAIPEKPCAPSRGDFIPGLGQASF